MKKTIIYSVIFGLILSFSCIGTVYSAPIASIGDFAVTEGSTITISVNLGNFDTTIPEAINNYSLNIGFDAPGLDASNAILPFPGFPPNVNNVNGIVSYTVFPNTGTPLTTDTLIANFDLTGIIPGSYALTFLAGSTFALDTAPVPVTLQNGSIVVNAVPIPGSILLLGSGLVGLIGIARRKRS